MGTGEAALVCLAEETGVAMVPTVVEHCGLISSSLPPLPDRYGFAGCFAGMSGEMLLAAGGANFPDGVMPWRGGKKVWHDSVFGLDMVNPESGWRRLGALAEPNGYGASIQTALGLVMIGGGRDSEHFSKVSLLQWTYDKLVQTDWPELPVARANACAAMLGNRIHLVGGTETPDEPSASKRHFVLDVSKLGYGWTESAPVPGDGVMLATAASAEDGLFVMGGCSLAPGVDGEIVRNYLRTTWCYSNGGWEALADLPRASVGSASPAWTRGDRIYLLGGDDGSQLGGDPEEHTGFSQEILCYDISSSKWHRFAEMQDGFPVALPGLVAGDFLVLVNGEIRPGVRTPNVLRLEISKHS